MLCQNVKIDKIFKFNIVDVTVRLILLSSFATVFNLSPVKHFELIFKHDSNNLPPLVPDEK